MNDNYPIEFYNNTENCAVYFQLIVNKQDNKNGRKRGGHCCTG